MKFFSKHKDKAPGTARRGLLQFRSCDEGSTAIEMSLIALPFFLVIFGIFEIGIQYFADRTLNASVDRVARMIRTGEIQQSKFPSDDGFSASNQFGDDDTPADKFRKLLCEQKTMVLFSCDDVVIDVVEIPKEENAVPTTPVDEDGNFDPSQTCFNPGSRLTVNLVRAYYQWPTMLNWEQWISSSDYNNGRRLLVGSTIIRNEPYTVSADEDADDSGEEPCGDST